MQLSSWSVQLHWYNWVWIAQGIKNVDGSSLNGDECHWDRSLHQISPQKSWITPHKVMLTKPVHSKSRFSCIKIHFWPNWKLQKRSEHFCTLPVGYTPRFFVFSDTFRKLTFLLPISVKISVANIYSLLSYSWKFELRTKKLVSSSLHCTNYFVLNHIQF